LEYKKNPKRNCKWARRGKNKKVKAKCNRKYEGKQISEWCPIACSKAVTTCASNPTTKPPTKPPTKASTSTPNNCVDSNAFAYKKNPKRNCKWARRGNNKKVKAKCNRKYEGKQISEWCPIACANAVTTCASR